MIAVALASLAGLAAVLYVVWPFVAGAPAPAPGTAHDEAMGLRGLLEEKERLLVALREIDFDHQTGKLTEEDLVRLREDYRAQARAVLREIDRLQPRADVEAEIERELARQLGAAEAAEAAGAEPPPASPAAAAAFCQDCGAPIPPGASFCGGCGRRAA